MIKARMAGEKAGDEEYERFIEYMARYESERRGKGVSGWAKDSWERLGREGIFDGSAPRDYLTREQAAAVIERLRSAA